MHYVWCSRQIKIKTTCNFKSNDSTRFYHYYWDMDTYFKYKQNLYIFNFTITEHVRKKKTGIPRQYDSACLYINGQGQSIVSCSVLIKTQLCCLNRECIYCVQPTSFESLSRNTSSQSDMFVNMHTLPRIMFFSAHPYALTPN